MAYYNQQAFFELLKTGLWGRAVAYLNLDVRVDWDEVYRLAEEQSVTGVILAGIEHSNIKPSQDFLLQWIGEVQILEQTNKAMNKFIEKLVGKMREADIYTLLVKGQGIAQCYERPLWRSSGDVDFFLSKENYEKAKKFLKPLSTDGKPERQYSKEIGYYIDSWMVELHASQRTGLSTRVDCEIDAVQKDLFYGGNVRSWDNNGTTVFLPSPDNDVFLVFTHSIKHFYKEGGQCLRQICDLCRLIWTYKESLNHELLEARIRKAGLMSEWKAFASLAVDYLGMPSEAMPLYSKKKKWSKKAKAVMAFFLKGGEWNKYQDTVTLSKIFPLSVFRFLPSLLFNVNLLKIKEKMFAKSCQHEKLLAIS